MNKQNTNPHWSLEIVQTVWRIDVWYGLIGGKLVGPYLSDGTLNGIYRQYLNCLTNELPTNTVGRYSIRVLDTRKHFSRQECKMMHQYTMQ